MAETNVGHLASREGTGATRAAQHVLRNEPFIARLHVQLDKVRAKLAAERHASTLLDGVQRQQHSHCLRVPPAVVCPICGVAPRF